MSRPAADIFSAVKELCSVPVRRGCIAAAARTEAAAEGAAAEVARTAVAEAVAEEAHTVAAGQAAARTAVEVAAEAHTAAEVAEEARTVAAGQAAAHTAAEVAAEEAQAVWALPGTFLPAVAEAEPPGAGAVEARLPRVGAGFQVARSTVARPHWQCCRE